ncbi:MAG: class I SAM-dependent methyltransferase [Candidatus Marinimicrobia bacterium]|nr:class I SAM-dependent methyltransferase [Candidatus Neomarinimicrobiota bacterium]
MQSNNQHSQELLEKTFGRVQLHRQIGINIERYSTNKQNIYQLALKPLSYNQQIKILDIGCGYGRFSGNLKSVSGATGSHCTGIDLVSANREPFLEMIMQTGLKGKYISGQANQITDFPNKEYDLILSGFSLNFFPDILSDIARIIKPTGFFIAITHSNRFLEELEEDINNAIGPMDGWDFHLPAIEFSSENGHCLLSEYFESVEQIDYPNKLVFPWRQIDECLMYIDFKLPFLIKPGQVPELKSYDEFAAELHRQIRRKTRANHYYYLNKDDCIFRCKNPRE